MNAINTRKTLLAAAAALTVLTPSVGFAQTSSFTWYGRLDLALESSSSGLQSGTRLQNFSSRLGAKGERSFNSDLSGIFQIETGVAPDDTANSKAFASRNSFVGVKSSSMGTLIAGTNDMPLKALEGTTGTMWASGDLVEILVHGKATKASVGAATFENVHTRRTNVLQYTSPKLFNTVAKLAYSPDESKVAAAGAVPAYAKAMLGASVEYNDGMFNGGLAYQSLDNYIAPTATVSGKALDALKITLGAKFGPATVGVALSQIDNNGVGATDRSTTNYVVTGTYALTPALTLKAALGNSSESAKNAGDRTSGYALQADYVLDSQFTVYTYATKLDNSRTGKGKFEAADNYYPAGAAGKDPSAIGVGVRFNF